MYPKNMLGFDKISEKDCKISKVRRAIKFTVSLTLALILSCLAKEGVKVKTTDLGVQMSDGRNTSMTSPQMKGKIDTAEIENNYPGRVTSFSLRGGWHVEFFEPQMLEGLEIQEQDEGDDEMYEIDRFFSMALTRDFPEHLTGRFEKWSLEGYGKYNIPVELNAYVEYYIYLFTRTKYRAYYERWLRRYFMYSDLVRRILASFGLPDDLVFVAMAESGFSTRAVSHMGAVGPWQFIYGTAIRYNLRVDRWIDERRDVILSTVAAARYLKDLYQMFGDWYLAWAGYNAGENRIERAIRITNSKDFWQILRRRAIPLETAGYVPKIIALAIITKNLEKFGFEKEDYYHRPIEMESVEVDFQIDIFSIAKLCGCSVVEIYELNPHLRTPVTPPYPARIYVPKGKAKELLSKLKYISENFATAYEHYYELSFRPMMDNEFSRKVIIGTLYIRPKRVLHRAHLRSDSPEREILEDLALPSDESLKVPVEVYVRPFISYRVRRGDTLAKIAARFGTSKQAILAANDLSSIRSLKRGMVIKVPVSYDRYGRIRSRSETYRVRETRAATIHIVKKGESLATISRKYGVTVAEIKRANNLKTSRIYKGQRLYIPVRSL